MRQSMILSCCALFLFFALGVMPQTARAAELTGFGEIKFGMTKEDAMAALDGRGEWFDRDREGSGYILYDTALDDKRWTFSVIQHFDNGRATRASLTDDFDWRSESNRWILETAWLTIFNLAACQAMVDRLVGIIAETHDVEPLSQLNLAMNWPEKGQDLDESSELYTFAFENQAHIQIVWKPKDKVVDFGCGLSVWYEPPLGHAIPF